MHSTVPTNPLVPAQVVRFGMFEADLRSGELRRSGVKVKLQELPFKALKLLLSRPNEVLSREEFRKELWPDDVFVDFDRSITTAINRVRDALGDSAENPVFVETVGRRGYRWIAPLLRDATAVTVGPVLVSSAPAALLHSKKWVYVLPVLAFVFAVWIGIPSHRPGRVSAQAPGANDGFSHRPVNAEAEQFYLQGRFYWNKRTPESLNKAVDAFTQALVHDPGYSQAYVGLADCYNLLREYSVMPATEAYPRAYAAARKAVELDDQSSEAHASLAFVSFYGEWDPVAAEREFRRAIDLNPYNATAHHWYGTFLAALGRYPESLGELDRAQIIDPSSKSVLADKGGILSNSGHRTEALALLKQVEKAEPDFISAHRYLKSLYFNMGDYSGYFTEARKEATLMHDEKNLALLNAAEKGYATGGVKMMLQSLQVEQKKLCDHGELSPYFLAETYALLGDKQAALQSLRAAYEEHSDYLTNLESDTSFASLHGEPAFRDLLSRVGLPPLN